MNMLKKCLALVLMMILLPVWSCFASDSVFIRIDRDDPAAWEKELDNVRFLQDEGMSGSAQFSENQFRSLASDLRQRSGDVYIVDCRLESHGFINGIAVSWCRVNNGANLGKTVEEVEADEKALAGLIGTTVTAYTAENDEPRDGTEFVVSAWNTEHALVESEGFRYLRLACPDHGWPPAEVIDVFIEFAKNLETNVWLHFHCQAGSGRTGAFMTIYEMMQKPDAAVEEILQHQADTGSGNLVKRAAPEKSHAQKERCVLARAVYRYINENRASDYAVKWSDWLAAHSRTVTMQVGDSLGANGFSSDPLVVTDSLAAASAGQATVLAEDTVYFITIQ